MVVLVLFAVGLLRFTRLVCQVTTLNVCIWWSVGSYAADSSVQQVRYAGGERVDYYVELMQLALSYQPEQTYQLIASKLDIPKQRAFDLMNAHQGIDILFGSASHERLANYRAVPFSILRGLNGYRVALVPANKQHQFKSLHSLQRLATYRAGQLGSWSDRIILEANQLTVETTDQAENLYLMLNKGRIDYFPLSVVEVQQELQKRPHLDLAIDPYIMLYYPTATYFYVAKDNSALADTLLNGLQKALADGRFDQLFAKYFAKDIDVLQLEKRRVFRLTNPLLPTEVSVDGPETWPLLSNPVSDLKDDR